MPTRGMTVDFWRVAMPADTGTFEQALDQVGALPDDESRAFTIGGAAMRLQRFGRWSGRREGDVMRIRMDEVPVRASLGGDVNVIQLADDEGVGEETAFLYIPALAVLIYQRNWFGISASRFVGYVQEAGQVDGAIQLEPVIEANTLAKLNSLRTARTFSVKLAGVHNPNTVRANNPGASVRKMADLIQELGAPNLQIYASMGHEGGSLDVTSVKAAARRFLRLGAESEVRVKEIEISGRTAGDEALVVDLVQDRVFERPQIELDTDRRLPYSSRRTALRNAFGARENQLLALFGAA